MANDTNFFLLPAHAPALPSHNGNGHHAPEMPVDLPDPVSLRQADLHALRLYAVGEPYAHLPVQPKLRTVLQSEPEPTLLINAFGPSIVAAVFALDPHHLPPLVLELADLYQLLGQAATPQEAKAVAFKIIVDAARLSQADLLVLVDHMNTEIGLTQTFLRDWKRAVKEQRDQVQAAQEAQRVVQAAERLRQAQTELSSWPYSSQDNQMYYHTLNEHTGTIASYPIADFAIQIAETILPEHGTPIHRLTGSTFSGKPVHLEVGASTLQDTKTLMAALSAAVARDPRAGIHVGMGQHLPMAIHKLTAAEVPVTALYRRTGWADNKFLMPGRDLPGIRLDLVSDLPYRFTPEADLQKGLDALMCLVASVGAENSLPALMPLFTAPLAHLLGLRDERYVTMIRGRTGKFKTSWTQTAMCLYGPDFAAERHLVKWGDGATTNAIEALAAAAHDMPLLVDNYKPNTGEGERGLIKLIHRMAEGSGRRRLDRNAELRPTPEIYSWLILTGEDTPQSDMATAARMLWISFDDQPVTAAKSLSRAQALSDHLCAVGRCWIEWLESPAGLAVVADWQKKFNGLRQHYLDQLLTINPEAINGNPRRLAQNLALNHLTWEIVSQCPHLGAYIGIRRAYLAGIQRIMQTMATATMQSNPGQVFVHALRELLSSGRALLIDPDKEPPQATPQGTAPVTPLAEPGVVGLAEINNGDTARRVIGYVAPDGGAYLFPELARAAIDSLLGKEALAQATSTALYKRLDELNYLGSKGKDGTLIFKKIQGKSKRVLHLHAGAIQPLGG